jgi:hypothetical protein
MRTIYFSHDISEFLFLLFNNKVRYLIVGGEAVIYYGHARLTGDIGFFMREKIRIYKSYTPHLRNFGIVIFPELAAKMS